MQNRYVADIGDYVKYALLRQLCGGNKHHPIRLAVVWCLFPDETVNNDGKHVSYLRDSDFAALDPDLHAALNWIVMAGRRHISSIAELGCLPPGTLFFSELVLTDTRAAPADRIRHRKAWLQKCLGQTENCDLVFLIRIMAWKRRQYPSITRRQGNTSIGGRLAPFWNCGHTLLIYHHLNRTASAAQQIHLLEIRLATAFDRAAIVPARFSSWVIAGVLAGSPRRCSRRRIGASSRCSFGNRLVSTFPAVWLAEQRSGKRTCRLTVDHLTRSNAEPINATTDSSLDHLNERSGFGCQDPVADPWIDVVQMVQGDPSGPVRLYRSADNFGIKSTYSTHP